MVRETTRFRIRNSSIRPVPAVREHALRWTGEPTECNRTVWPNWTTPLFGAIPATLFGTFSQSVVIASSTEDDFFDLFIAVQAPAASVSNSSLSGAFTVGTLDFLDASVLAGAAGLLHFERQWQRKYRGVYREWLGSEFELRQQPDAERCGLDLCALRHGGWDIDLSRYLRRSDADRQRREDSVCISRWQLVCGEVRQPERT